MNGLRVSGTSIYHNVKEKQYPNGLRKITVASRDVYKEKGWEASEKSEDFEKVPKPKNMKNGTRTDSLKRAKQKVFDIAVMNHFDYFITLTLNAEKINRYSVSDVMKKLKVFLRNSVTRYGLKYLLVAEHHKDGAIHMHGLVSGNMKFENSGTFQAPGFNKPVKLETLLSNNIPLEKCHKVYNMPQWTWGYSTAIQTYGDVVNCAKYITKYITKDVQKIFGNFYYAGGNIIRDVPYSLYDVDYESINCEKEYYCEPIATHFKFFEEKGAV